MLITNDFLDPFSDYTNVWSLPKKCHPDFLTLHNIKQDLIKVKLQGKQTKFLVYVLLNKYLLFIFWKLASNEFILIKLFHATGLFKTSGFLMFSGVIERDQWHEIGQVILTKIIHYYNFTLKSSTHGYHITGILVILGLWLYRSLRTIPSNT